MGRLVKPGQLLKFIKDHPTHSDACTNIATGKMVSFSRHVLGQPVAPQPVASRPPCLFQQGSPMIQAVRTAGQAPPPVQEQEPRASGVVPWGSGVPGQPVASRRPCPFLEDSCKAPPPKELRVPPVLVMQGIRTAMQVPTVQTDAGEGVPAVAELAVPNSALQVAAAGTPPRQPVSPSEEELGMLPCGRCERSWL